MSHAIAEHGRGPGSTARWADALLFALAVVLRVVAIAALGGLATPPEPGSDASEYDAYAWNVAQGRGYRGPSVDVGDQDHLTAYRPPVPSLFFAAIYRVAGHSYVAAQLGNAVLGGLTVLWLVRLGSFCFGRRVGLLAGLAFAVFPPGLSYSVGILSEPIAALLVVAVVDCAARIREPHGGWYALAAGLSFGLLLLSKPGFIFTLPFAALWALYVCGRDGRLWARALGIGLTTGLVILPWALRNLMVLGVFIPFGTGGGQLLLCTSNRWVVGDPKLYGYSVMDNALPEYRAALAQPNDEIQRDAVAKAMGVAWLKANPDKWFYLARTRLWRQWAPWLHRLEPIGWTHRAFELVLLGYFTAFLAGLPWATVRLLRERRAALMMHVMLLGNTAMAVAFHGQHRYRFPTESLSILIGAAGAVAAWEACHRRGVRAELVRGLTLLGRRPGWIAAGVLAVAAFGGACLIDQRAIERYRLAECEQRLERIAAAAHRYRQSQGQWPASLDQLIPRELPNLDVVHCPKHSIRWHDYQRLAFSDPQGHEALLSYRLEPASDGVLRVVETEPRHAYQPLERFVRP